MSERRSRRALELGSDHVPLFWLTEAEAEVDAVLAQAAELEVVEATVRRERDEAKRETQRVQEKLCAYDGLLWELWKERAEFRRERDEARGEALAVRAERDVAEATRRAVEVKLHEYVAQDRP